MSNFNKIEAMRGKLVAYKGKFKETKICDKGLFMDMRSDGSRFQLGNGDWVTESQISPMRLVVDVNFEEKPHIPSGWESHPDAKLAMKKWSNAFQRVEVGFDVAFYFMDSIHHEKATAAQTDWIDLSEFCEVSEVILDRIVLATGEEFQIAEFKRVLKSLAFQADVASQCFNSEYNRIPYEQRAAALDKFKEALSILEK